MQTITLDKLGSSLYQPATCTGFRVRTPARPAVVTAFATRAKRFAALGFVIRAATITELQRLTE